MKTFKEFRATKKYVAVIYDEKTQKKLKEWAEDNGFDLSLNYSQEEQKPEDFDFHTTIFFTSNEVDLKNNEIPTSGTARVKSMDLFGENNDIPVLLVDSPDIMFIRQEYEKQGLEDEWPDYKPHISVSYAKEKKSVNGIKVPDFILEFDKIVIKDGED